jgi:hypothetical protein
MSDREDKLAQAASPSPYYIFPVVVGDDGQEDFGEPICQARRDEAIVHAMHLEAQYGGLLVVACYGPPLDSDEEEESFFYHVRTFGTVSDKLRDTIPV